MSIFALLETNPWFRKKVLVVLFLVVVVLIVIEIWAVNRLSDFGGKIAKIEQTKQALKLENQVLENQIAQSQSLSKIQEEAKKIGLDKIKNIKFIRRKALLMVSPSLAYNK